MAQQNSNNNIVWASVLIRAGLALTFFYAAYSALTKPELWIDYVPHFLTVFLPAKLLLDGLSIFQLVLAVWLLWGRYLWVSAGLAASMLIGIVVFNPSLFVITFRDLGLGLAALGLVTLDAPVERIKEIGLRRNKR